jgi:hypothetical protein
MRIKLVLGAGLVLLIAVIAVLVLEESPRRSGSNYVPEFGPVTELRGGDRHCQDAGLVPADTAALDLLVGTHGRPTPDLDVTVTGTNGQLLARGRLPGGQQQGRVAIPTDPVEETAPATVCIRTGPGGRTVLYGRGEHVRLAWLRPGSESRLDLLPAVAHRFGLGKANPFGDWLLAVVALVLATTLFLAIRLVVRETGP